ncbi:MAG TPA: hypothetical protein ENN81_13085, partial [Phycisphaerales bacterium]|nr:hypothetical protein [Phycisphaerales bacterium]
NDPNNAALPAYRLNPYISYGGGIAYIDAARVQVVDSNVTGNFATIGGGVYGDGALASTFTDSNFADNVAFKGGAIYAVDGDDWTIENSTIVRNQALRPGGEGGGLFIASSPLLVFDSNISSNEAAYSGGGVYAAGSGFLPAELHNNLITHNIATRDGGGISANWHSELIVTNCTIADNEVVAAPAYGGGIFTAYGARVDVTNSIIWDNVSRYDGTQIGVGSGDPRYPQPSSMSVSYSIVEPGPNDPNAFGPTALDIVFMIDSTGSMGGDIAAVAAAAGQITQLIGSTIPDFRIAVVDYRDFDTPGMGGPGDYPYRDVVPFTRNVPQVIAGLNTLAAGGGGDEPESVYAALMHCMNPTRLETDLTAAGAAAFIQPASPGIGQWRPGQGVARAIIVMADAPPHDPEAFVNYTLADIVDEARSAPAPKQIFTIPVRGTAQTLQYFTALAQGTGGIMIEAAASADVVDAIMEAIRLMAWVPPAIYVENGCQLSGWDAAARVWAAGLYNIEEDPNFVYGYYLAHLDTGQDINSPAIDAGSASAADLGLAAHTTRIDGVFDAAAVDMGYHYRKGVDRYELKIQIVEDPLNPGIHGRTDPNGGWFYDGTVVKVR